MTARRWGKTQTIALPLRIADGLAAFAEYARRAGVARQQRSWRGIIRMEVSRQKAKKAGRR